MVAGLGVVILAVAWPRQETGQSIGSITVKLPPAHSSARPQFNF